MKKLINVRYPLIVALSVAVAIVSTVLFIYRQYLWVALAFFILSAVVTLCFVKSRTALAVVILASYLVGVGVTGAEIWQMERRKVDTTQKVVVSGYVDEAGLSDGIVKVVLDRVELTQQDGSIAKLSGKTKLYLYDDTEVPVLGTKVTVIANIDNLYVFRDGVEALDYCNGVYYKLTSAGQVVYGQCNPTFDQICLNYFRQRLGEVAPQNGNLAYALLTGDRSLVDDDTLDGFADAGVMHVFAVSGLHVGFVVAVFGWILDRLRVKRWAKLVALVVPLTIYAYVCGFPASVVRATIMTAVALLLQIAWRKTDLLNSISISAVVLLVVNPLNLFNAGFLLSFGAVYGIATVSASLKRLIDGRVKGKFANKILSALAVSIGATLGTVLISAHYFGSVATLAVAANLVVVPLVSVIFVLSAVSLLPLFFGYVGGVVEVLLGLARLFSQLISNLPFATLDTPRLGVAIVFWLILLFVLGGFINVKGKAKTFVCLLLCLCLATSCVVANLPINDDGSVYLTESNEGVLVVANDGEGNYLVVSNCTTIRDVNKICDRLNRCRVKSLSLAFTNYKSANVNALKALLDSYSVDCTYVFDGTGNSNADNLLNSYKCKVVVVPPNQSVGKLYSTCIVDGVPLGLQLTLPNFTFLIAYPVSDLLLSTLASRCPADVVYSYEYLPKVANLFGDGVVLFGKDTKLGNKTSLTECGNFTIYHKSGTIKVTNGGGKLF